MTNHTSNAIAVVTDPATFHADADARLTAWQVLKGQRGQTVNLLGLQAAEAHTERKCAAHGPDAYAMVAEAQSARRGTTS